MNEDSRGAFEVDDDAIGETPKGKSIFIGIAIDRYDPSHFKKLNNPVKDVTDVGKLLLEEFQFDVVDCELINEGAEADKIDKRLRGLAEGNAKVSENDNLIIYFAGHGVWDGLTKSTSIVPVDGRKDAPRSYFGGNDLLALLSAIPCQHLLLILDCCYGGGIAQEASESPKDIGEATISPESMSNVAIRKSRYILTSGWIEPVPDGKGGENSPFALALRTCLSDADDINFLTLVNSMRPLVLAKKGKAVITQSFAPEQHEHGEMVFHRKKDRPVPKKLREALFEFNYSTQRGEIKKPNLFNLIYLHGTEYCGHHLFANRFFKERGKDINVINNIPFLFRLGVHEGIRVYQDLWELLSCHFCNVGDKLPEKQVIAALMRRLESENCLLLLKTDKRVNAEHSIESALLDFWEKLNKELASPEYTEPEHSNRFFLFLLDRRGDEVMFDRKKFEAANTSHLTKAMCFSSFTQVDRVEDIDDWLDKKSESVKAEKFLKIKKNLHLFEEKEYVESAILKLCEQCERIECYDQIFLKHWKE